MAAKLFGTLKDKAKAVGAAIGVTAAEDEELVQYKTKLASLETEIKNLRSAFCAYSDSVVASSNAGTRLAMDITKFYNGSQSREALVRTFNSSAMQTDNAATKVFKETFGWDVVAQLDDWMSEVKNLRKQRTAEVAEGVSRVAAMQKALQAEKDKKLKPGQKRSAEEEEALKREEEKVDKYTKALARQRAKLDEDVNKIIEGRHAMLDSCLVRLMECQMEYAASARTAADTCQNLVQNYRHRHPLRQRSTLGSPTHTNGSSIPASALGADSDDEKDHSPVTTSTNNNAAAAVNAPTSSRGNKADPKPLSSSSSASSTSSPASSTSSLNIPATAEKKNAPGSNSGKSTNLKPPGDDEAKRAPSPQPQSQQPPAQQQQQPKPSGVMNILDFDIDGLSSSTPNNAGSGQAQPSAPGGPRAPMSPFNLFDTTSTPVSDPTSITPRQAASPHADLGFFSSSASTTTPSSNKNSSSNGVGDFMFFDTPAPAGNAKSTAPAKSSATPANKNNASSIPDPVSKQKRSDSLYNDFDPFANENKGPAQPVEDKLDLSEHDGVKIDGKIDEESARAHREMAARRNISFVPLSNEREELVNQRVEKMLEDQRRFQDRQAAALEAKAEALTPELDAKLIQWHGDKDGVGIKNIRTLLSSLHLILWSGTSWKPLNLSDLMDPKAIQKAHRKANLIVHPDKVKDCTPQQRAIAERVYDVLNQSWAKFEKENARAVH